MISRYYLSTAHTFGDISVLFELYPVCCAYTCIMCSNLVTDTGYALTVIAVLLYH